MRSPKVYHAGTVKVVKYHISWADTSKEELIEDTHTRVLAAVNEGHGGHYHNPEYSIFAPTGNPRPILVTFKSLRFNF